MSRMLARSATIARSSLIPERLRHAGFGFRYRQARFLFLGRYTRSIVGRRKVNFSGHKFGCQSPLLCASITMAGIVRTGLLRGSAFEKAQRAAPIRTTTIQTSFQILHVYVLLSPVHNSARSSEPYGYFPDALRHQNPTPNLFATNLGREPPIASGARVPRL